MALENKLGITSSAERSRKEGRRPSISLRAALTNEINSREVSRKGINHSYYREGYGIKCRKDIR